MSTTAHDRRLARERKAREKYAARMQRLAEQANRYYEEVREAHPRYGGESMMDAARLTDDITIGTRRIVERWGAKEEDAT